MRVVREIIPVKRWVDVDHHRSHALLGLYDSPFQAPLVFSFDGGGNDGYFKMCVWWSVRPHYSHPHHSHSPPPLSSNHDIVVLLAVSTTAPSPPSPPLSCLAP